MSDDTPRQRLARRLSLLARPRVPESLPVRLDRRRVYVLPTGFGAFFAALLFSMVLGALNYNNNPALLLALLLCSAGLASLMAAHLQLSGLSIDAIGAEPVPAGAVMQVHVAISARDGRTRRGLRLQGMGRDAVAPVLAGDPVVATLAVPTEQLGWLDPDRIRLSTTQPLGLARAWSWVWPQTPLLVYPMPESNGPPLPEGFGQQQATRLHPAGEDMHHLRAYRAGDPRRAISWKHSARRDALLVREYEQPLSQDVALDWQALSGMEHELRIRRLARWVDLAEREGRRYRLALPGQPPLGPSQGPAHRHLCLRALALLPHVAR